jgi:hypothetical protein
MRHVNKSTLAPFTITPFTITLFPGWIPTYEKSRKYIANKKVLENPYDEQENPARNLLIRCDEENNIVCQWTDQWV